MGTGGWGELAGRPFNRIQKYGPNRIRRKECMLAALGILAEAGRIRYATEGRRKSVKLNPALLKG